MSEWSSTSLVIVFFNYCGATRRLFFCLQVEKDALAELRHAKEKEREAAAAKEIALADAIEVEKRQIEALEAQAVRRNRREKGWRGVEC